MHVRPYIPKTRALVGQHPDAFAHLIERFGRLVDRSWERSWPTPTQDLLALAVAVIMLKLNSKLSLWCNKVCFFFAGHLLITCSLLMRCTLVLHNNGVGNTPALGAATGPTSGTQVLFNREAMVLWSLVTSCESRYSYFDVTGRTWQPSHHAHLFRCLSRSQRWYYSHWPHNRRHRRRDLWSYAR